MSVSERLDGFQRRHKALSFPLGVVYKFFDDQGNYLAALITYYAFIALIPLLLLASSILGFILSGSPGLQQDILDSALAQFPVISDLLNQEGGPQGSTWAVIIGGLGALYGAMGVAQALQNAMNIAWAVPRNKRPNPFSGRLRSLGLLVTAGLGILVTTWVTTLGSDVDALRANVAPGLKVALIAATVLVNATIFTLLFRLATTHEHSLVLAIPGALVTSALWQLLQYGGTVYVSEVIQHASRANQYFAGFLGLLAYLYLGALCVIFGVEVNVVKAHRLYPRALLTPFTDNVNLTEADRRAYADYAAAQRTKDFAHVDVRFEYDGQYRSAKRQAAAARAARDAEEQRLKERDELTEARQRKEARQRVGEGEEADRAADERPE
jgi:YihY family inner membrane protein